MKKRYTILISLTILCTLATVGFASVTNDLPIYVNLVEGTTIKQAVALDDQLDLDVHRYVTEYEFGDTIGAHLLRWEGWTAKDIENDVWNDVRESGIRSISSISTTIKQMNAARDAQEPNSGSDLDESIENATAQQERYRAAIIWHDENIADCWLENTCPALPAQQLILNTITAKQHTALSQNPLVKSIHMANPLKLFLPGIFTSFDWRPNSGSVRSGVLDDKRRYIRANSTWSKAKNLSAIQERGFYRLRLALNDSLNSELGPFTYISKENAKFSSNFPRPVQERDGNAFAEVGLIGLSLEPESIQKDITYYAEWRAFKEPNNADQDNADLYLNTGKLLLANCEYFFCRIIEQTCIVDDEFGVAPIPGEYTWTEPPDDKCSNSALSFLPFIGN